MPKILVSPTAFRDGRGPWRPVLEKAGFEVVLPEQDATQMKPEELISLLRGIDGVLASVELYSRPVLAATKLRAIARVGVGYDSIDVPAASDHGVAVCTTPGTNHDSVAEQAIALITGIFRDLPARDREIRNGTWRRKPVRRLAGNTLGLLGLGRIGKAIVPRAHGLGLTVIAYDPFPDRAFAEKHDVRLMALDEVLAAADIVSLHLPWTAETSDLINAASLKKMKRGSVLVNTARGGLVDEQALAAALESGQLSAAGLDVFKTEPLPADSPLARMNNVVLCPHMGGLDQASLDAMSTLAAQCLVDLHAGHWPEGCVVNDQLRQGWKW
ncbi:MAG TPA: phosphoglycerate dehydrogenase [Pirellulales bacterium]|jgi:phosphoglycerate dehydrogenase-like enzyme|nr:phosphoglycerate dehydrogenase [Pirellulales bacterium]